ncbi:hypothetical protein Sango_2721600 [Sesamum angolense]|uniref:Reverse transcriptase/retrotransposon-derived protein RNase H-like domain-containing protein n=1 Tax=Sesamum angolense TaxID=2727404 RepID=A0AAE1W3B9_9LAMI|nr:hypothetical protein Sango_2721600 [Sesamum angolense]
MVSQRGIEANPAKIKAILDMGLPTNINKVQRLIERKAALSRFKSKSAEKDLPFFKTIRKTKDFEWTEECQQAFEDLKAYLAKLPLLGKPMPSDTLYLYLSSTPQAISSVLVREEDGGQTPIYYVSKVLNGAECRYLLIEMLALALVATIRKLHPYFLSYPVRVRTNTPLKQVLGRPEASGRLASNVDSVGLLDPRSRSGDSLKINAPPLRGCGLSYNHHMHVTAMVPQVRGLIRELGILVIPTKPEKTSI